MTGQDSLARRDHLAYLDVLRVAATYCVILLHCLGGLITKGELLGTRTWWAGNILEMLSRMGVPIFFMISGCLLLSSEKTLDILPFYKRRMSRVALPFLVWDVVYYLRACYVSGTAPSLLCFLRELLSQGSAYHLWFVYMLLGMYLVAPFLKRMVDRCSLGQVAWLTVLVALPQSIFGAVNLLQSAVWVSFLPAMFETYLAAFLLGYLLGRWKPNKKTRLIIYVLGILAVGFGALWNYHSSAPGDMRLYGNYGYAINHYFTAGAFFLLVRQLTGEGRGWLVRLCTALSPATYGVYLCHVLILTPVLQRLTHGADTAGKLIAAFLVTTLSATGIAFVLAKIKYVRRVFT